MNDKEKNGDNDQSKKEATIIVNGKEKLFQEKKITFIEVIELAFDVFEDNPLICYTVDYLKGDDKNKEGMMVKGDEVKVKDGMIFDVTRTDKS